MREKRDYEKKLNKVFNWNATKNQWKSLYLYTTLLELYRPAEWQQHEMFPFISFRSLYKLFAILLLTTISYPSYYTNSPNNVSPALCVGVRLNTQIYNSNQNNNAYSFTDSHELVRQQTVARNLILAPPPATTTTQQPPIEVPDFEEPIGNHTVALGRNAELSCKINNLGKFRTAWLRVEDKGILTIHNNTITRNYRISVLNNEDGKNFVLTIKNVQPSDKVSWLALFWIKPTIIKYWNN